MSSFTKPLVVKHDDKNNWEVKEPFSFYYYYNTLDEKVETSLGDFGDSSSYLMYEIDVHVGFITDFASVPKILWGLFSPYGIAGKPAVIHDFLYRTPGLEREINEVYSKKDADHIFLIALKVIQAKNQDLTGIMGYVERTYDFFFRQSMYLAVKYFGGSSWKNYR